MARYKVTKAEAEEWLQLWETAEENGIKVGGVSFGDGKYYGRKFLEAVRDNGGFVIQTEPLIVQHHIVVVPNSGLYSLPANSYMGMVKSIVHEIIRANSKL